MYFRAFAADVGVSPSHPEGFGAAGIMSQNGALVRFTYPSKMLGRGLGLNGSTVASGILAAASWEWLFAVNVLIGIGA